ncbi:MAG: TIGR01440 family protein [Clostridia bacterium]|nr:TIGR01440 family protein [Clostridia bacterium]
MPEKLFDDVKMQARKACEELCDKANLAPGRILVVGCSSSEVCGDRIGSNSNADAAAAVLEGICEVVKERKLFLAAQCCEHLNRAIVIERAAVPGAEPVNVIPKPKAGGSFAAAAYLCFEDPVVLEEIKADAGIDIGDTLIGMHLRRVAVPVRLSQNTVGMAHVTAAKTRPKYIGGERAVYDGKSE